MGFGSIQSQINFSSAALLFADDGELNVSGRINSAGVIGTANAGKLNLGTQLDTGNVTRLELNGGRVTGAEIINNGEILGYGEIRSANLTNNGRITTFGGSELVINPTSATFDLDGTSESGELIADDADIRVEKQLTDFFDGTITANNTHDIHFSQPWTLGVGGTLNLGDGTGSQLSVLSGGLVTVNGNLNSNLGRISADVFFRPTSVVTTTSSLTLSGNTTIQPGATFLGPGFLSVVPAGQLTLNVGSDVGVDIANNGHLRVSAGIGSVDVAGLRQTVYGTVAFRLRDAASDYDQINAVSYTHLTLPTICSV